MDTLSESATPARQPRPARPWPYFLDERGEVGEGATYFIVICTMVTIGSLVGLTSYHGSLYQKAGISDVYWVGAAAAQSFVVGALGAAATLYRWGHPMRSVYTAVAVAAGLAGLFALLPHLVSGRSWITTLLGVVFSLAVNGLAALWIGMAALHIGNWWRGWHRW